MADQQTDLSIIIEAVNKASSTLKQVEKDLSGLTNSVQSDGEAAATASLSFGQLVAGVATGTAVAQIATSAFGKLASAISGIPRSVYDLANSASEIEGIAVAMHVVANNAGITADAVDKVRNSVVEQNVTTEAANRLLTDLIRNQLDYTQATELASAAQNIAVASGVSSSETIERISDSIASGNTWLLRQLGLVEHLDNVYEKYGETLGKTSEEMTEAERKQAVVNYVLSEGEKYAGAYEQAMGNASKVIRSTRDRVKEIAYSFGKVLEPALYEVSNAVYQAVNSIVKWAHENEGKLRAIAKQVGEFAKGVVGSIKNFIVSIPWDFVADVFSFIIRQVVTFGNTLKIVSNSIQVFARALLSGINTIKSFGQALAALIRGDFDGLKQVYADWRDYSLETGQAIMGDLEDIGTAFKRSYDIQTFDLQEWWKNVEEIEGSGWEDRLKIAEDMGEKLTSKQKEKLDKMLRDIEKENRDYQQAVEKRAKSFEESFEDLVISHRDKIQELTDDLAEESRDYNDKLVELLSDYNEAMDDIEVRHREKTESIMEDMEDERKKAEEEIEKITEAYEEEVSLIEKEGQDRVNNLKTQLAREKALGANADNDKIKSLEEMIAYEEKGLSDSLSAKKAKYDEEVSDVNEKLDEKLEKIKSELEEENLEYEKAFAKRKEQYEEDVLEAKQSYEEKRRSLQEELDKELAIREKYAEDFARLADKVAEDDITRLVRKYNDEKAEMEREHEERLADIKYQAFESGEGFTAGFSAGFDSGYPAVKSRLDQMSNDIDNVLNKANPFSFGGGSSGGYGASGSWGDYYTPNNYPGSYPYFGQYGGVFNKPTIVGEAGAEVVLPLNFPKRMAQIMKSIGIGGQSGGQVTQNFYVTVNNSQDVDVLMERAGFAMKQGGGYK